MEREIQKTIVYSTEEPERLVVDENENLKKKFKRIDLLNKRGDGPNQVTLRAKKHYIDKKTSALDAVELNDIENAYHWYKCCLGSRPLKTVKEDAIRKNSHKIADL